MNDISKQFTYQDLVGQLIPGIVFIFGVLAFLEVTKAQLALSRTVEITGAVLALCIVAGGYAVGSVLSAISFMIFQELGLKIVIYTRAGLSENVWNAVLNHAKQELGTENATSKQIYQHCRATIASERQNANHYVERQIGLKMIARNLIWPSLVWGLTAYVMAKNATNNVVLWVLTAVLLIIVPVILLLKSHRHDMRGFSAVFLNYYSVCGIDGGVETIPNQVAGGD